jgi:hypothetical protein
MRRTGASAALRLPGAPARTPEPACTLEIVKGRQTVRRHGIFFSPVSGHRRSVYMQLDGEIILADECECRMDWPEETGTQFSFVVTRNVACPIDEHKRQALQGREEW